MKRFIGIFVAVTSIALVCFFGSAFSQGQSELANQHKIIHRIRGDENQDRNRDAHTGNAKPVGNNGIVYHGGPLLGMNQATTAYFIWYGNWSGNSATTILTDFASGIGGSPYFNINTIQGVVSDAISSGRLPSDVNGVYFVLTSSDVTASSGFCTQYCGWHTRGTISGSDIKYSFVGNPDRCPSACEAQTTGPNGNAGADGMASIVAHELEEAVTDPDLNAWYDHRGEENADKCAWTFGTTYTTSNGALANIRLGSRDYLIQRNWVNAGGGFCALSY